MTNTTPTTRTVHRVGSPCAGVPGDQFLSDVEESSDVNCDGCRWVSVVPREGSADGTPPDPLLWDVAFGPIPSDHRLSTDDDQAAHIAHWDAYWTGADVDLLPPEHSDLYDDRDRAIVEAAETAEVRTFHPDNLPADTVPGGVGFDLIPCHGCEGSVDDHYEDCKVAGA